MINKSKLLYFLSLMLMFTIGCEDEEVADNDSGTTTLETPAEFVFESRFEQHAGESSVSYSGQVVRNLLVNDIKTQIGTDAGSGDATTLLSMMANDDPNRMILTSTTPSSMQTKYHDISTMHLNDRLDAVSDYILPGYEMNAGDAISAWVTDAVTNGKTNADGIRLDQMVQKTLWGAVAYWQGTSKYMSKIPNDDNTMSDDGDPYTAMEHHWDESFGYFGAARDYNTGYSDDNARKTTQNDSNGDGFIDFKTEFTYWRAIVFIRFELWTSHSLCSN